jgi:molybdopterin synthase catalytic subunit
MKSRLFALSSPPVGVQPPFAIAPGVGALVSFDGIVRNLNENRAVLELEYSAYAALAEREGERIVGEAIVRFRLLAASCVHRVGRLSLGEVAVRVWAAAEHRQAAFSGCGYIIDEIKARVPIWKRETYAGGERVWVFCSHVEQEHAAPARVFTAPLAHS